MSKSFVYDPLGPEREELFQLIKAKGYKKGDFLLTSGKRSNFYMNIKGIALHKRGKDLLEYVLSDQMDYKDVVAIAGMELGAVPLVMAAMSGNIHGLIIRKKTKVGGLNSGIEGLENVLPDSNVILLDDVATTGGSLLKSLAILKAAQLIVKEVWCIVDRQEGAKEILAKQGYVLKSLYTKEDFLKSEA